jgi:uncharacterized protein (DUF2267 family)
MSQMLSEDKVLESAKRRVAARQAALIAEEMERSLRRVVSSAMRKNRKELQSVALEAVEAELKNEKFKALFRVAVVRALKNEIREENLTNLLPDLLPKVGEAMLRAIIK